MTKAIVPKVEVSVPTTAVPAAHRVLLDLCAAIAKRGVLEAKDRGELLAAIAEAIKA